MNEEEIKEIEESYSDLIELSREDENNKKCSITIDSNGIRVEREDLGFVTDEEMISALKHRGYKITKEF